MCVCMRRKQERPVSKWSLRSHDIKMRIHFSLQCRPWVRSLENETYGPTIPCVRTYLLVYVSCFARPNFFVRSSRIRVDLLSYESKTTDKRQQNDWRAKKNLDGWLWTSVYLSSFLCTHDKMKMVFISYLLPSQATPLVLTVRIATTTSIRPCSSPWKKYSKAYGRDGSLYVWHEWVLFSPPLPPLVQPVKIFLSPPVVLPSFISRFALVR